MNLCKYKNIFGLPGEGVHSFRVANIAVIDTLTALIVAVVISKVFNLNLIVTLCLIFLLGVIAHRLFCVQTTVDKFLFK